MQIYTHQVAVLKALMEDPTPLFSLDLTVPLAGPEFASRMAKFKETVSKGKINLPGAAMEKVANDFANGTTSQKYILTELAKSAAMGMLEKTQVFCKDQLEGGRYHTNTLARVFTPEQLQGWCIPTDPTNDNSERFLGTGKQYMRRNAAANLDTASLHTTLKQAYLSDLFNDSTLTQEELDACRQVGRSFSEEDAKKTKAGAEMEIAAQKIEEQESYIRDRVARLESKAAQDALLDLILFCRSIDDVLQLIEGVGGFASMDKAKADRIKQALQKIKFRGGIEALKDMIFSVDGRNMTSMELEALLRSVVEKYGDQFPADTEMAVEAAKRAAIEQKEAQRKKMREAAEKKAAEAARKATAAVPKSNFLLNLNGSTSSRGRLIIGSQRSGTQPM